MSEPVLFLVDGPSGAGKSHLLRYVESTRPGATAIRKNTTRTENDDERGGAWTDLVHVSDAAFDRARLDFTYRFRGNRYGFSRDEIVRALERGPVCLVVVRDTATIRRVAAAIPGVRSVSVLVRASEEIRRRRLAGRAASSPPGPVPGNPNPAPPDPALYEEVLVNEASAEAFHERIDAMIERYAGAALGKGETV
jgi:guanylate kinase